MDLDLELRHVFPSLRLGNQLFSTSLSQDRFGSSWKGNVYTMPQACFQMETLTLENLRPLCFVSSYIFIPTFLLPPCGPGSMLRTGDTTVKGTSLSPQTSPRQYRAIHNNTMTCDCCMDTVYWTHFIQGKSILKEALVISFKPMSGWVRNGYEETRPWDPFLRGHRRFE